MKKVQKKLKRVKKLRNVNQNEQRIIIQMKKKMRTRKLLIWKKM